MHKVIIDGKVNEFETIEDAECFKEEYIQDHDEVELGFDGTNIYIETIK